jgi:FixJ family two-component response regulator
MTNETMTVFVVDDDEAIREALLNLLESEGLCARVFPSTEAFLDEWSEEMTGCLVLDVRLPGASGVELQEKLIASGIRIPIIFMTAHGDVPMVRKVMKAGAVEFLSKPFQREELLSAIEQAFAREREIAAERTERRAIEERMATLSPREVEVLELVTEGMLNKQIAGALEISEITVKLHRRKVMEKMQANSLAELVKMTERIRKGPLR